MTVAADIAASLLAFLLMGLCLLPAGWLAARRLGLDDARAAWSLLLGIALVPMLVTVLARPLGLSAALAGLGAAILIAVLRLHRADERQALAESLAGLRDKRLLWGGALWLCAGWLLIADLTLGGGLSLSGVLVDYAKHISVTDAVSRTGVPPINPSFHPPGEPTPLFYYYYWFLLCSLADVLGGSLVAARHAVYAGTLWAGLALVAVIRVYAGDVRGQDVRSVTVVAAGLLLVTGLDLVPFLVIHLHAALAGGVPGPLPDLEWWNEQVTAWLSAVLWVPHHVAALVVCLAGFKLAERGGALAAACAGAGFAAALGMSVWVTLAAAVIAAAWCAVMLARGDWRGLGRWLAAGAIGLALALPFIIDLAASSRTGAAPVGFAIREFFPVTRAADFFGADVACGSGCRLLLLPLNYALELGLFALAAVLYWRRRSGGGPPERGERFLVVQTLAALLLCSLAKAQMAATNDLGWRGMMFVQFPLLLWSAPVVADLWNRRPQSGAALRWMKAAALLGVAATLIAAVQLRLQPPDAARADLRRTYLWIAEHTASDAIIQHDPALTLEPLHTVYGGRQSVLSDRHHGHLYGVSPDRVTALMRPLAEMFAAPPLPAGQVAARARSHGIAYLVVKQGDAVWTRPDAWPWQVEPVFATATTRVVAVADLR